MSALFPKDPRAFRETPVNYGYHIDSLTNRGVCNSMALLVVMLVMRIGKVVVRVAERIVRVRMGM